MKIRNITEIHSSEVPAVLAAKAGYESIANLANRMLQGELEKFDNGQIGKKTFLKRSKNILSSSYKKAFKKGAGINNLSSDHEKWIDRFSKKQFKYLHGFADDIDASEGTMDYDNRMGLYANAVRAAYWGGVANESGHQMDWITTAEESCDDCLANEAGSPYEPDNLPGTPGDGSTRCGSNCKCYLVRSK